MKAAITMSKPLSKPKRPYFSSGPCAKPLQWKSSNIDHSILGRSHRSDKGIALLNLVLDKMRRILSIPDDYEIAIVPGSATGACEMAFWNLLGERPVDVFSWDVFSKKWLHDIRDQLKITHRSFDVDFGQIPNLANYNPEHDCCFVWSGTTAGVNIPDIDWIPTNRSGITICDATSAMFSFIPPWEKLDVTTFSFQKVLGGEAAHGVIILSPRAIDRLNNYTPSWPIPTLLSLTYAQPINGRRVCRDLFEGKSNNTPSLWCIADAAYSLDWIQSIGNIQGVIEKVEQNYNILEPWVEKSNWISFLATDKRIRSKLAITLTPTHPTFLHDPPKEKWSKIKQFCDLLATEDAAYDIKGHALAAPNIRIWCGPTVEPQDIKALLPWLDYAATQVGLK